MKRIIIVTSILVVVLCHAAKADFLRTEYKKVSSGGTRMWTAESNPGNPCPEQGNNCQVTITPDEISVIGDINPAPGGGWLITVDVPQLTFEPTGSGMPIVMPAFPGFTFGTGEYQLRIVDWPGNPSYNGITIPCDGKTVSASGTITLYVP